MQENFEVSFGTANLEVFFGPMWHSLASYIPDLDALRATPARVVIGIGTTSEGQFAHRTAVLLAERLGLRPVVFPGDHGGMFGTPWEFTDRLLEVPAAQTDEPHERSREVCAAQSWSALPPNTARVRLDRAGRSAEQESPKTATANCAIHHPKARRGLGDRGRFRVVSTAGPATVKGRWSRSSTCGRSAHKRCLRLPKDHPGDHQPGNQTLYRAKIRRQQGDLAL
jgi:hypothetical protein